MSHIFSDRIADVPKSFIREILKATASEGVISFAGGLPNRQLFPIESIKEASAKVLDQYGADVLQYSSSEGYEPLRQWIADRYKKRLGIDVNPKNILITSGSQQGLDLIGKVLINEGDHVAIEEPGYLGAIQAFSLYRPKFNPIPMNFEGLDNKFLAENLAQNSAKVLYAVPNFQNPSGISHSEESRNETARILSQHKTLIIEDDPYGELQFSGPKNSSYYERIPEQTILLGSFSKIFVPSFRIGWIVTPDDLTDKILIAKQASDLHTNYFAQRVLFQHLLDNDIDEHIEKIKAQYFRQKEAMVEAIQKYFPPEVEYSNPNGGMFLWLILKEGLSAKKILDEAMLEKVAFVPGDPFYIDQKDLNTVRLNFSCVDEETIHKGIEIIGRILKKYV